MIFTLLRLLGAVKAFVQGLASFAGKHPVAVALAVALVATNVYTFFATEKYTEAKIMTKIQPTIDKLAAEVEKANAEIEARNAKIAIIKADSHTAANAAAEVIAAKDRELDRITSLYHTAVASSKVDTYTVTLPNAEKTAVNVQIEDGHMVCNRFPSAFTSTVNSLVEAVNKPLELKAATDMVLTEGVASK